MELRRFKFYFLFFHISFALSFGKKINGTLSFPFSKFTMKNIDSLILNLSCKDKFSNMKECAEQCYYSEKNEVKCVAFVKFKNTEECYICNPATTQISDYSVDLVYIFLKNKRKKPVMYLPLERDNITGNTVIGDGVTGTLETAENTKIQAGKVSQGLYVKERGRLVLENTANACMGNLSLCTNGLSIALWINPSMHGSFRHISHSEYSINIVLIKSGAIGSWTSFQPNIIHILVMESQSVAPIKIWTHVTVVFDPDVGMFIYMNGILDAFKSIDEAVPRNNPYYPNDYVFGSKGAGHYPFDGTLDEIKVFYESLTSIDIWREYISYKVSFKEEESWGVMVNRLQKDDIVIVQTDSIIIKDEIALIRVEDGVGCSNKENSTSWFVYDHKVTNGCKIYQGHTSALWSGNQTLTSGACSWWYIP